MSSANSNISLLTNIINNNSKIAKSRGQHRTLWYTISDCSPAGLDIIKHIHTAVFPQQKIKPCKQFASDPNLCERHNVAQCQRPFSLLKSNIGE